MKKTDFIPSLCASTLVLASVVPAHGKTPADGAYDEIIVTATRTPVSVSDSLSSVTVVTRDDLEALQPRDLVEVFQRVPGIDISQSGGPGSAVSLFVRGAGSDQTLILVDGQRISSATAGSASLQFLDPSQIERIEIVRGASSSLYGSDAIGGVIQIFTKDGKNASNNYVTTEAGSHNLWRVAAGSNGSAGNFRYGMNVAYLNTQGIDNLVDDTAANADEDGYRNDSFSAIAGYRFAGGADLSLRFLQSNSRNEYDSAYNPNERPYAKTWVQNVAADLALPVNDIWSSKVSLGRSTDDSDNYDDVSGAKQGHFRTTRDQLLWQNDLAIVEGHTLTLAYDFYEDQVDASTGYEDAQGKTVKARNNQAAFIQHQGRIGQFSLVLGLRNDDNEEFGNYRTGNAALGYRFDDRHQLSVSWSEGFKAPTFNDLYWPASPWSAGNPDLLPESSDNYEASVRGDYATWYWSVAYFDNEIENLINWAPGPDFVWRPYNVSSAEINGAELLAGATLNGWRFEGSLYYVNPVDAESGDVLNNRAKQTAQFTVEKDLNRWSLGLDLKGQSERYIGGNDTLAGYGTIAARIAYRHSDQLSARLKVNNLLDKDYQLNEGYHQAGASWLLSLNYSL